MQKKVFKVVSPIERKDGSGVWWMRCGSAYVNKDESINVYLESLPLAAVTKGEGIKIQLRELTDEELRERAEKKSSYSSRGGVDPNGLPSMGNGGYAAAAGGYGSRAGAHGGLGAPPGAAQAGVAAGEPIPF